MLLQSAQISPSSELPVLMSDCIICIICSLEQTHLRLSNQLINQSDQWMLGLQVPFSLVFTKTDKRKKKVPPAAANIKAFCDTLLEVLSLTSCPDLADKCIILSLGREGGGGGGG